MAAQQTIAFTISGHNEAHLLKNALESVKWADELVYVDCDSLDNSIEVAKAYTEKVYSRPNLLNLNVNKTFGMEKAETDWIFFLDCDEVISPALAEEIKRVINSNPEENAFWLPRRNYYFGKLLKKGNKYPDEQLRLFRRGKAHFPLVQQHEKLVIEGSTGLLTEAMDHYTLDSPGQAIRTLNFRSDCDALRLINAGFTHSKRNAFNFVVYKPFKRLTNYYIKKRGYKEGMYGLMAFIFYALEFPMSYFKAWHWTVYPERKPEWEKRDF